MDDKLSSVRTQKFDEREGLNAYRKKFKIISLILLILGALGSICYIVLSTVLVGDGEDTPLWIEAFLIFAIPLALGLVGCITLKRLSSREKAEGRKSECEFFDDCFFYRHTIETRPEGSEIYYYPDVKIKRESEKYIYLFAFRKGIFISFSKFGLTESQLNAVRLKFGVQISGESVPLAKYEKSPQEGKTEENK